jgi:hypothetical protein
MQENVNVVEDWLTQIGSFPHTGQIWFKRSCTTMKAESVKSTVCGTKW